MPFSRDLYFRPFPRMPTLPEAGAELSWTPLFTPSPFLTRAVASLEPELQHAWSVVLLVTAGRSFSIGANDSAALESLLFSSCAI